MEIKKFSEEIRTRTSPSHQALEKLVILQIRKMESYDDYKKLLSVFYGYYKPVENLIATYLHPALSAYKHTRKADLIRNDLSALQYSAPIPLCEHAPCISDHDAALGALYVLEGSTLGGKYILQMIRKKLALEPGVADQFFSGHGDETEMNWEQFKKHVDRVTEAGAQQAMLTSVSDTFTEMKNWVELNYAYEQQERL